MRLPEFDWTKLERLAHIEVEACIRELPDEIREIAQQTPCLYKRWHPNAPHIDPEAIYMLGEYLNYGDEALSDSGVIALYLGAIAWYCEDERLDYKDEIRRTYLHELGHHLGWGEDEVEQRGL